jgi:hypothetical protein
MQCQNCKKELPADDWVFVRVGGPIGKYTEKLASIIHTSEAVYCSEECMRKKEAADHQKRRGS